MVGDQVPRFTGKERDAETGLDYFGARYFGSAQGRMTSPDPLLQSGVPEMPQSWNRYSYVLNNPLAYVDPTGLAWVKNDGGSWEYVNSCSGVAADTDCRSAVAINTGKGITIYGSQGEEDITHYAANEAGVIDMNEVARHRDSNFLIGPQQVVENYLNPEVASTFFNVAGDYGTRFAQDSKLVFTGGSVANGGSGLKPDGSPIHGSSHRGGTNIDMRYVGNDGRSLVSLVSASLGDVNRNTYLIGLFRNSGFAGAITGDPGRYGLAPINEALRLGHRNHIHIQRRYPFR